MIHKELTSKIIRSAMNVHNELGNGFQEVIYQRALEIEMNLCQLNFSREKEMEIYFHEQQIGTRRIDFFCGRFNYGRIKSNCKIEDVHLAQAMNYLEAYKMQVGLLINFGARSLEFRRVHKNV
jgi:GxxExxY protein